MSVCLPPSRLECRRAPQCGPLCWSRTPQTGCTSPLQTSQQSLNCLGCNQTSAYFVHKHLLGRDLEILIIHIVHCTVSVHQVYSECTSSLQPVYSQCTSSVQSVYSKRTVTVQELYTPLRCQLPGTGPAAWAPE